MIKIQNTLLPKLYTDPVIWSQTVAPLIVPWKGGPFSLSSGTTTSSSPFFQLSYTLFTNRLVTDDDSSSCLEKEETPRDYYYVPLLNWKRFFQTMDEILIDIFIKKLDAPSETNAQWWEMVEVYLEGVVEFYKEKVFGFISQGVIKNNTIWGFGGGNRRRICGASSLVGYPLYESNIQQQRTTRLYHFGCFEEQKFLHTSMDVSNIIENNGLKLFTTGSRAVTPRSCCTYFLAPEQQQNDMNHLFSLISSHKWSEVVQYLSNNKPEASSWAVQNENDSSSSEPIIPCLPIHTACMLKAPKSVVTALLDAYPEGVQSSTKCGALPLHLACRHGAPLGTIRALIRAYPKGASVRDSFGLLPIHLACSSDATTLSMVEALLRVYPEGRDAKDYNDYTPLAYIKSSFCARKTGIIVLLNREPIRRRRFRGLLEEISLL